MQKTGKEGLFIITFLKSLRGTVGKMSEGEKLVFFNLLFVFLPVFISGFTTFILAVYVLRHRDVRSRIATMPYAVFLALWAVLSLISGLVDRNFLGDAGFLVYIAFIVFGIYTFTVMTPELCECIIRVSALLSIPAMLIAAVERFGGFMDRPPSTFYNANYYGFICELIILMCVYGFFAYRKGKTFFVFAGAVNLIGILICGCRSALPAVYVGAIVVLIALRKYKYVIAALILGAAYGVAVLVEPRLMMRADSLDSTADLRVRIWKIAYHGFLKKPFFGRGYMGYWTLSHGLGRADQPHAHNLILNALVNYGVVGFAVLLGFIVPALVKCLRLLKKQPVCALVLGAVAAVLVHGITDDPIMGFQTGVFAMTVIALAGSAVSYPQAETIVNN